jgi:hypothetical protein
MVSKYGQMEKAIAAQPPCVREKQIALGKAVDEVLVQAEAVGGLGHFLTVALNKMRVARDEQLRAIEEEQKFW